MSNSIDAEGPDLTTEEGVLMYLMDTPFSSTKVTALSGGTANYVFRIHLKRPYEGRETLVFKHARPYVKTMQWLAFDLDRQIYEVEALRRVKSWLPSDAIVTVPAVHLFDEPAHAIIMDDCGEHAVSLKEFMQNDPIPSGALSALIGQEIGKFIGEMHIWGRKDSQVNAIFSKNVKAKKLSAWVTYGRVVSTLTGEDKVPKLSDPPLEVKKSDLEAIKKVAEEMKKEMEEANENFVMGDFWPGNMMVRVDAKGDLEKIYILDWEMAKTGVLGVELGQFCAEIHLLRRCREQCKENALTLLQEFIKSYGEMTEMDSKVWRQAVIQWGAHMIVLGGRVEWGDKGKTREIVSEGVEMMVKEEVMMT